jgi:hypothetical protein
MASITDLTRIQWGNQKVRGIAKCLTMYYPINAVMTVAAIPTHPVALSGFMCFAVKKWSREREVPKSTVEIGTDAQKR